MYVLGTCLVVKTCDMLSDYSSSFCSHEIFTTVGAFGVAGSFSTITELCAMSLNIKERRVLSEETKCICEDATVSAKCCGDLD